MLTRVKKLQPFLLMAFKPQLFLIRMKILSLQQRKMATILFMNMIVYFFNSLGIKE